MIKRLSISIFVGVVFIIITFRSSYFSTHPLDEVPIIFKVINWSSPFWEHLYSDELLCTMSGYRKVEPGSCLTNGVLASSITYLILWLRVRKAKLKLR
jgi:hypothetical protein